MKTLNFNFAKPIVAAILALVLVLPLVTEAFVTPSAELPFNVTNWVPGSFASGSFTVSNTGNGSSGQVSVFIATTTPNFALFKDWVNYEIGGNVPSPFSGNLEDLTTAKALSVIPDGGSANYTIKLSLDDNAPQNPLMGKSFSFDLVVVLDGQTQVVPVVPQSSGGSSGSRSARAAPVPAVLGESTSVCEEYLTGYIHPNKQNDAGQVTRLQTFLRDLEGHHNLIVNGVYDEATQAAVSAFQRKYAERILGPWGLPMPTSFVYYTTRKMVNEIYCQFTVEFPLSSDQEKEIAWYRERGVAYNSTTVASSSSISKITETVSSTVTNMQETVSSIGQQAAAAVSAGTGFWSSVRNFFRSLWPW